MGPRWTGARRGQIKKREVRTGGRRNTGSDDVETNLSCMSQLYEVRDTKNVKNAKSCVRMQLTVE